MGEKEKEKLEAVYAVQQRRKRMREYYNNVLRSSQNGEILNKLLGESKC